jgi:hypothetical protein
MWTLIVIIPTNGAGASSGSSSSMTSMIFASEEQRSAAATQLSGSGYISGDKSGPYQIIAKCIERATSGVGGPPKPHP